MILLALTSIDGIPELGATGGVGALVVYVIMRLSKIDSRVARIEGRLLGPGDTEQIERKGRRRFKLPILCVLALLLTGCNVTRYQRGDERFVSYNFFQTTKLEKFSTLQKTNSYSFRSGGSSSDTDGDAIERFLSNLPRR